VPSASRTLDLFGDDSLPEGFRYQADFLSGKEEHSLLEHIKVLPFREFEFHGVTGKRRTVSFGWRYDFDHATFGPAEPMPDWLMPVREKAAQFAGLSPETLVQALLIRYDPGAGIGWHRDRPVFDHVLGISLGAAATMRFRRRIVGGFSRTSVLLAPRSIYHLTGEARHQWEHSIAGIDATRWSVTFRSLSEKARLPPSPKR